MNWWKASTASAIAQAVRMLSGLVLIKIIAVALGPDGFGHLGHFMSMIAILSVLAGGGILNGIVKYAAEYKDNPEKLYSHLSSSLTYSLVFSFFVFLVILIFAKNISMYLFGNYDNFHLIIFLGIIQFFYGLVTFCNGVVNGLRETGKFAKIIVIGTAIGLPLSCYITYEYKFPGAVVGLALINASLLVPGVYEIYKLGYFNKLKLKFYFHDIEKISKFSLMQMFSISTLPVAEIYIRNLVIHDAGWVQAGLWQSLMRLSSVYLGFFTTFLAAYYMPTLSGINGRDNNFKYVLKYILILGGAFLAIASTVYVFRSTVFLVVFSKDFVIPSRYLRYQLLGDFFKILSYVIGFLVVAKAKTRLYILGELTQTTLYLGAVTLLIKWGGIQQIFPAYALSNFLYFSLCFSGLMLYGGIGKIFLEKISFLRGKIKILDS